MNIHHIAVASLDPESLSVFYESVFGWKRVKGGNPESVWLDAQGSILMLEKSSIPQRTISAAFLEKYPGYHLISWSIPLEERSYWIEKLTQLGIIIEMETDYTIYFTDPEGNRIGLSHYPEK